MLEYIPTRKVKNVVIEQCYELIKLNEISDKMSDKELGERVIKELSKKYLLTEPNKRTIMDYFRKGMPSNTKSQNGNLIVYKS